jgi:radical SAM superfamily enzyme YgiQ (UPF0313 family)
MHGVPGERPDDLLETIQLWEKMFAIKKNIWIMGPFLYRPYPGTLLYEEALKLGFPEPKSLRDWGRLPYGPRGDILDRSYYPWITPDHWGMIDYMITVKNRYYVRNTSTPFRLFRKLAYGALKMRLKSGSRRFIRYEHGLINQTCNF